MKVPELPGEPLTPVGSQITYLRQKTASPPVWTDILEKMVAQGSISREVAARVVISGMEELQCRQEDLLDLLQTRIKVAKRAMVADQARLAAEWDGAALERKYAAKVPKDAQVLISAADYAQVAERVLR